MQSSDEDFESADEGHSNIERKERKKRLSSSNYSDNALESDQEFKTPLKKTNTPSAVKETITPKALDKKEADGWDDFDINESDPVEVQELPSKPAQVPLKQANKTELDGEKSKKSQGTGWDDFGDWDQDDACSNIEKDETPSPAQRLTPDDKCAPAPTQAPVSAGWGWGWSVDSLLTTATAGITSITTQVSQGISTVLETSIGAPDPEELAKASIENHAKKQAEGETGDDKEDPQGSGGDAFQLGSLLSGVTKFVETTGTKVLTGGLDTLETIGKKTMEVLQDGDPGLAKKRAMLGLDSGDKPILSQVLREAKAKADEEDQLREVKREAKEVHYETLFDDFEGLVHLEALEMLSKQTSMRIEERIRTADPEKRQDLKETLQQVAELCEMPEDEDEDEEPSEGDKAEVFHEKLQTATQDLGLKLQFQSLIKQYTEILEWLDKNNDVTDKGVYKRCVSALAQTTALSVQTYHKAGELLLTKQRRSTADEADALTQLTVVLTKHISVLASLFTEKLNSLPSDDKDQINNYITNIFLEAGNSSTYVQNAFQLALPILQIGAV